MGKFLDYPIILHLKHLSNSIKPYSTPLSIVFPIMVGLIPCFFFTSRRNSSHLPERRSSCAARSRKQCWDRAGCQWSPLRTRDFNWNYTTKTVIDLKLVVFLSCFCDYNYHPKMWRFPKSWGYSNGWMIYKGKPIYKWMMTGGTPILGNPHTVCTDCRYYHKNKDDHGILPSS